MLIPEKYTFIFVAINLIVLYIFMRKILFKPVTNFMENRKNSIEQALNSAEDAKSEAAKARVSYEEPIKNIKLDSDKLVNEAKVRAVREAEDIIAAAKKEALAIVQKGYDDVERERAEMLKQIRQQVAVLALSAASKVVEANMDTAANKVLVDKFIDEAGAA